MRNLIIDKLLNDKVLNKDEILYLCHNLTDNNEQIIPYDHSSNTLGNAIGLSDGMNPHYYVGKTIKELLDSVSKEPDATSMVVELCEAHALRNQLFLRGVIALSLTLMVELSAQKDLLKALMAAKF